jgi:hypothetical protein
VVRPFASLALLVLLGGLSLACNGVPSDGADAEAMPSSTLALVSIQRSSSVVGQAPRVELVARFVRSRTEARSTFAALGSDLSMPPLGTCTSLSAIVSTPDEPAGPFELLDVGRVQVTIAGAHPHVLEARELPNLGDFARGTFYALSPSPMAPSPMAPSPMAPSPMGSPAGPPGSRYDVTVAGSNDFGPLAVSGIAPQELSELAFDGVVATGSSIHLNNTRPLRITWATEDAGHSVHAWAGSTDIVYVDTSASHETKRCAFADTGMAELPPPNGERGQVEVHRLRRHAATPTTELRFDFYRAFTF